MIQKEVIREILLENRKEIEFSILSQETSKWKSLPTMS